MTREFIFLPEFDKQWQNFSLDERSQLKSLVDQLKKTLRSKEL